MTANGSRRVRVLALILPLAAAALALLAWSQAWVIVDLNDGRQIVATGDVAAPSIPPFAFAALAMVGALSLVGVFFRVLLGVVQALLGVGIAVTSAFALGDPVRAAASRITEATGVDGIAAVVALVDQVSVTLWPSLGLIAGIAAAAIGVGIAVTATRWPRRTSRFDKTHDTPVEGSSTPDRLQAWDALSDGTDPTAR
jgi:hypothetical protein